MARSLSIYSGQWGDLDIETLCCKIKSFGYDGIELGCSPLHLDLTKLSQEYCDKILDTFKRYDLKIVAISNHLVGQCVCDIIDQRHKSILPDYIWGDGKPEGVRQRAIAEMKKMAIAAKMLGVNTIVGFTGSPIWHLLYSFPPVPESMIQEGYELFAECFTPILDEYQKHGIRFALEVHPTEIAFDIATSQRTLEAIKYHPAFGFNFDPSHLGYQGVDYVAFIYRFAERIFHVHIKDVWWSDKPTEAGVFGGYVPFGDPRRFWNFRSVGHGRIQFGEIIRALNHIGYTGPLSVEWEDNGMEREYGAKESCERLRQLNFTSSNIAFDAAFEQK